MPGEAQRKDTLFPVLYLKMVKIQEASAAIHVGRQLSEVGQSWLPGFGARPLTAQYQRDRVTAIAERPPNCGLAGPGLRLCLLKAFRIHVDPVDSSQMQTHLSHHAGGPEDCHKWDFPAPVEILSPGPSWR